MLEVLGLDPGTEAVYRLMLAHPAWGVDRLAAAMDTDRQAVTRALDTLADLALLRSATADGAPGPGRLVPPRAGLGALLERRQSELARTQLEIDATRAAVADLLTEYTALGREPLSDGGTERFAGAEAVRRTQTDLAARATDEFLALTPAPATDTDTDDPWRLDLSLLRETATRGARVRILATDPTEDLRSLAATGAEVRMLPSLPVRLSLADGAEAALPLDPAAPRDGVVLLREPGALAGLRALFRQLWDAAEPLPGTPAPGATACTSQERALLRHLADGLTDEAAARRLGISLRSERRLISQLSEQFGARSRFQLGLEAARSGLV
ncbi:helix-turn-helix domain-containing protein [Streptomyces omiyaensis]|uniref:HTH luxR-type domain-containing protein n=1 Tax=Streptomyces omiyaensis TaxID=68247 RepID=A0ABW7C7K5_9ACTN|nr:LuxR family transcriptional regulator [Streptomyces omiyaensis]GGY83596.1 transcriptional regulator [Streptomyces omiyaensis]